MTESENPGNQPPDAPPPEKTFSKCPSCGFDAKQEKTQCDSCGLQYAKWKDPQQLAAERKLAALSESNKKGMPAGLKLFLFLIVAIPLALFLIPELQTSVLGGRLVYNLNEGENIKYEGVVQTKIFLVNDANAAGVTVGQSTIESKYELEALSSDTGGNFRVSVKSTDFTLDLQDANSPYQLDEDKIVTWAYERSFNGHGKQRMTMMDAAANMGRTAQINKQHMDLRQQKMQEGYDGYYDYYGDGGGAAPPPEPVFDPMKKISRSHISPVEIPFFMLYPKERVKPEFVSNQKINWRFYTPKLGFEARNEVPFKLTKFNRMESLYLTQFTYEGDVELGLEEGSPALKEILKRGKLVGQVKGTAFMDYNEGLVHKFRGTLSAQIPISPNDYEQVITELGLEMVPDGSNPRLKIDASQEVDRIR